MSGIGSLNEKPLHASLKEWYAQPGDRLEVKVDGYVVDIVRNDLLLEIQTGHFASVKAKLMNLVRSYQIRLAYPIALEKWIVKPAKDESSGVTRRKSPRRGRVEELFMEMVSFPHLLANPNFSIEVLLTKIEEVRRYEGKRKWRSRGWGIEERRLLEVVDRRLFEDGADLLALLPEGIKRPFTARDLAEEADIGGILAQKMVYCLRKAGAIELAGRRGRANLYRVANT